MMANQDLRFVDMSGQTVGGWKVLRRAANVNGNARWLVQHHCSAQGEKILEGIRLRSTPPKYCDGCRPKRPGTVQRRPLTNTGVLR